jgi:acetoin:2,6-dichlorophenolindophenol oxidoreductase subunit beta
MHNAISKQDVVASGGASELSFGEAINAALAQAMELEDSVLVYGIGADGKGGIFGSTTGLVERFGTQRVFDTPIAEQALTAMALGAATAGLRPVLVHQRFDFLLYAADPITNWIAPWRFISGGRSKAPLTLRVIVGKGWGQGPQHSKSLHAWFAHIPGLQVVMPASPADAKGLLLSSIFSDDPTLFIEGRALYTMRESVPDRPYFIRLGEALTRRTGNDLTIVSFGSMIPTALQAAEEVARHNIDAEVIDLRCLMPLDLNAIVASVCRTGRLIVVEPGWRTYGAAAEIIASVVETLGPDLKAAPRRVTWPHAYVGASPALEQNFYPTSADVVAACQIVMTGASGSGRGSMNE